MCRCGGRKPVGRGLDPLREASRTPTTVGLPRGRGRTCAALHIPIKHPPTGHHRAGHARPLPQHYSIQKHRR